MRSIQSGRVPRALKPCAACVFTSKNLQLKKTCSNVIVKRFIDNINVRNGRLLLNYLSYGSSPFLECLPSIKRNSKISIYFRRQWTLLFATSLTWFLKAITVNIFPMLRKITNYISSIINAAFTGHLIWVAYKGPHIYIDRNRIQYCIHIWYTR